MRQVALIAALFAMTCWAQAVAPEPEFSDMFYRLDGEKLVTLERQNSTMRGGASGFVYMKMKLSADFPGAKSPIRFQSGVLALIVRPLGGGYAAGDPNSMYYLRKLEQRKNARRLTMMDGHVSPVGSSISTNLIAGALPVEFTKYGEGSLKLTTGTLPPGEYAVGRAYGQAAFCFGVD